ncbi:hypothetical protein E2C01_019894 [Portunus trituberculatus]|uniref:Uncharacterized protein n=1 Tax=Portunus trituberculatus TaxID=210409 RepID=A0A5B7E088_PORTR|nr:hypothetical protein [Portunus trituberculatus]
MSSSGDDQIKSLQVFNPPLRQHPAVREAVIGEWQLSHRTLICKSLLKFQIYRFFLTNSKNLYIDTIFSNLSP